MKAKLCKDCHFNKFPDNNPCVKGHHPRFYLPSNGNPYDDRAGYKRKCSDFKAK